MALRDWMDDIEAPPWATYQMRSEGYGVYWASDSFYSARATFSPHVHGERDKAITNSWEKRPIIRQLEND